MIACITDQILERLPGAEADTGSTLVNQGSSLGRYCFGLAYHKSHLVGIPTSLLEENDVDYF
jgi:hypothetical protein